MDELLQKLPDADAHKSLGILESVGRELKQRKGDAFLNSRYFLSCLQRRLASTRNVPSEELVVSALNILSAFAGCMDADLVAGVPAVFAEAVPALGKDGVRKAAGALVGSLLKRAPSAAVEAEISQAIIDKGLRSENVSAFAPLSPSTQAHFLGEANHFLTLSLVFSFFLLLPPPQKMFHPVLDRSPLGGVAFSWWGTWCGRPLPLRRRLRPPLPAAVAPPAPPPQGRARAWTPCPFTPPWHRPWLRGGGPQPSPPRRSAPLAGCAA
jgi:hypothetical protein